LTDYTDLNWVGFVDDRKSTIGYVFSLGTGAVSRASKKQHVVSLSSTEAEYRAATKGACEAVWLERILGDLMLEQTKPTLFFMTIRVF